MTGFTHMLESCLAYAYSATYKCHIQLRLGPMQNSRVQVRHVERDRVDIIVHARWVHHRFGMILDRLVGVSLIWPILIYQ